MAAIRVSSGGSGGAGIRSAAGWGEIVTEIGGNRGGECTSDSGVESDREMGERERGRVGWKAFAGLTDGS